MAKDERLKLYERDHFDDKVDKKLEPVIEVEELRIKATVQTILNKGTKTFAKNIGADKVINALQDAEDRLKKASRNAYIFFDQSARKQVAWSKLKEYKFDRDEKDKISVKDCEDQLEKWAEAQAKQLSGVSRSTRISPQSLHVHAGIWCPHQICREMHQSRMFSIHSK